MKAEQFSDELKALDSILNRKEYNLEEAQQKCEALINSADIPAVSEEGKIAFELFPNIKGGDDEDRFRNTILWNRDIRLSDERMFVSIYGEIPGYWIEGSRQKCWSDLVGIIHGAAKPSLAVAELKFKNKGETAIHALIEGVRNSIVVRAARNYYGKAWKRMQGLAKKSGRSGFGVFQAGVWADVNPFDCQTVEMEVFVFGDKWWCEKESIHKVLFHSCSRYAYNKYKIRGSCYSIPYDKHLPWLSSTAEKMFVG